MGGHYRPPPHESTFPLRSDIIHGQSLIGKKGKKQKTIYCFPSYLKIFQPKRFQIHFRSIFFNFIFSLWKIDFLDLMDLTTVPALWTITLTSFKPICNTSCMKWMTTQSHRYIIRTCMLNIQSPSLWNCKFVQGRASGSTSLICLSLPTLISLDRMISRFFLQDWRNGLFPRLHHINCQRVRMTHSCLS